jgi:hypothetical protein
MVRYSLAITLLFLTSAVGCGGKNGQQSLCDQVPAPAACMVACDPTPGAANSCPAGYHCNGDGKCDAQCTANGGQCGTGYVCTSDGTCVGDGSGSGSGGPDANCPAVHFAPMGTTPSVELVLDRSGSMTTNFGGVSRYQALTDGLFGATGAVTTTQASVYFGEALFAGDQSPCLSLTGFSSGRALNNAATLKALTIAKQPNNGSTPTADAITLVTADFAANPPPAGSPPIILLATDGDPNSCGGGGTQPSIDAVTAAHAAGIRTFIVGLAGLNTQYLQDIANAGTGKPTGQNPMCATCSPFYTASDPASLAAGFNAIIAGVLSCDLTITGMVDPASASQGTLTLNGTVLVYGTDWVVDPNGMTIHILGGACTTLKGSANPVVDASFPCGVVIQ